MRAAVATGVFIQIELMVVLGVEPRARRRDLGPHRCVRVPFLLHLGFCVLGDLQLLFRIGEDGGPILGPAVVALPVPGGWVVGSEEELDQGLVVDLVRVEEDQQAFGVSRGAGADGPIRRRCRPAAGVANAGVEQTLAVAVFFAKDLLHAPETAGREGRFLGVLGEALHRERLGVQRDGERRGEWSEESGGDQWHPRRVAGLLR